MSNEIKTEIIGWVIIYHLALVVLCYWAMPNFSKGMEIARQLAKVNSPALSNWPRYGSLGLLLIITLPMFMGVCVGVVIKRVNLTRR